MNVCNWLVKYNGAGMAIRLFDLHDAIALVPNGNKAWYHISDNGPRLDLYEFLEILNISSEGIDIDHKLIAKIVLHIAIKLPNDPKLNESIRNEIGKHVKYHSDLFMKNYNNILTLSDGVLYREGEEDRLNILCTSVTELLQHCSALLGFPLVKFQRRNDINILVENDWIEVSRFGKKRQTAIISFSGIGPNDGQLPQGYEFRYTFTSIRNDITIYFIHDKTRTWFNEPYSDIVNVVNEISKNHDIVLTIGASMGGFGAIHFGLLIPNCRKIFSFAAQYGINEAFYGPNITDRRWHRFYEKIQVWNIARPLVINGPIIPEIYMFYGKNGRLEMQHSAAYRQVLGDAGTILEIEGIGHGVATYLREKEILSEIIDELGFRGSRIDEVHAILLRHNLKYSINGVEMG